MPSSVYRPLAGVRVLSLEIAFALPAGTRALHELGADVVRVTPPRGNPESWYISVIDGVFHGKPCVSIDLTTTKGQALAYDLAREADVVCNNFRPGTMDKYGLGAARLREARPELIWLQLSGYGTPGPWSTFPAFGPSTEAAGGLNRLLVDEGEVPLRINTGVFADQLSGRQAALAIVHALEQRRATGAGATIDLSMTECITHLLGSQVVRSALDGAVPPAERNRDPAMAPQGVYPCKGDDEWVAISIRSNREWSRLVEIVGDGELDAALGLEERRRHHDRIDATLARWTAQGDKDAIADRLQGAGIAAAAVRTVADSVQDPQFRARGAIVPVRHQRPLLGFTAHPHPPLPWRIIGRLRRKLTDYRNNGQDNASVLHRWLGMGGDRVRTLEREGVLRNAGPVDITEPRQVNELHDPDFGERLGLPQ